LTKQQWQFARRASRNAKKVLIAGDDDQAIFQWAGADLRTLLSIKGERKVLPQSYRLPQAVFDLAQGISQGISHRYPKLWKPRGEAGEVHWMTNMEQVNLSEGSWLMLGRHTYLLQSMEEICRQQGVVYHTEGQWSNNAPYVKAIVAYEKLRAGEAINRRDAILICSFIVDMPKPEKEQHYKYEDFRFPFSGKPDWMDALTRLSPYDREYVRSLRRNHESLTKPGRVTISTIHGSKGGEADNVLLLTDMSTRSWKMMEGNRDEEARVWYVGVSRAKVNLFLVVARTAKTFLR
jgi:superfamily I DNA/RNA helicase